MNPREAGMTPAVGKGGKSDVYTVIAWIDPEGDMVPTGRMVRFDGYNYRPEVKAAAKAHAVTWQEGDYRQSAADYLAKNPNDMPGGRVYVIQSKDPLGVARKAILANVAKS